ncbi:extensin-like isoform X4 [Numida meleagris]|uniref:extensin-like isoform X4 n=1 Tax=Numida meleagris TaxID=8996 RepID=UPI000B3D8FA5|nr:extensin-like isoform X4 [Numida meleagris]
MRKKKHFTLSHRRTVLWSQMRKRTLTPTPEGARLNPRASPHMRRVKRLKQQSLKQQSGISTGSGLAVNPSPHPRQAGPPPPRAHDPQDAWRDPPREHQHWRARGRGHLPGPWQPRPFPGPVEFLWNEENGRWAPQKCDVPPPAWNYREDHQSHEQLSPLQGPLGAVCQPSTSSLHGSRLEQHFGKMSSKRFCRRGPRAFPWEPHPRQAGPPPPRAHDPQDAWRDPPRDHQHWRARGRGHLPGPWQPRPFPGPVEFLWNEENGRWAPQKCDVPPPPWNYREDHQGHEIPPLRHQDFFAQPEFPSQEQRPAGFLREQEVFQDNYAPQRLCGPYRRRCRLLLPIKQETTHRSRSPRSSPGYHPSSKPSRSCSPKSQPGVKEHLSAPQSPTTCKNSVQSKEQVDEGLLVASSEALDPPGHAEKSPEKSLATNPQATEQEPAAGSKPVEPQGGQEAAGNQQPSALELEPVSLEITCTRKEEALELIKPHSPSVSEASGSAEPYPYSPLSPEPAETVSAVPILEIPLEATAETNTQPSKASSNICAEAAASPRTGHPPWAGTQPAAGFQHLPCPLCSAHHPTGTDLRSAAILAKKESIEQGYKQFCLNFAMVSMMLLQKDPSMEVALMQALRANLLQVHNRLVKEMEDFIQQYDETHPSR